MLIQGSDESEARALTLVGAAVVLCIAMAGLLVVINPFGGRPPGLISVAFDTPYVGQGVAKGTAVIMHGVTVGEVTAISSLAGGGLRLNADLQKRPITGLTDALNIDFRPINYFGVTGVNLIPEPGGQALADGTRINTVPKGNFTLEALLSGLGALTQGVITPQLIQVLDKATRYTDALDPLIETALIVANAVAQVQTVSTARLLTNATGLSVAFPSFANTLTNTGQHFESARDYYKRRGFMDITDDEWQHHWLPTIQEASTGLFNSVGLLESKHVGDLLPLINVVKTLTDVVPPIVRPEGFANMLAEMRTRFEKMYAGTPEQRALRIRIVLDSLPGVAAPIHAMGGP